MKKLIYLFATALSLSIASYSISPTAKATQEKEYKEPILDVIGLKIGMKEDEAFKIIQNSNDKLNVQYTILPRSDPVSFDHDSLDFYNQERIFGFGLPESEDEKQVTHSDQILLPKMILGILSEGPLEKNKREKIYIELTGNSADKKVVGIKRIVVFDDNKPTVDFLKDSILKKYGMNFTDSYEYSTTTTYLWAYDSKGRLLPPPAKGGRLVDNCNKASKGGSSPISGYDEKGRAGDIAGSIESGCDFKKVKVKIEANEESPLLASAFSVAIYNENDLYDNHIARLEERKNHIYELEKARNKKIIEGAAKDAPKL